jgi:hypothetical protein
LMAPELVGRASEIPVVESLLAGIADGEAQFSFAGLHQLLRPVLAGADSLPRGQRDALLTALGVAEGPAPAMPMVGLAVLELLTGLAERTPLLVVAEDAHCLDLSTCEVLAFVSRRLGGRRCVRRPGWPGARPCTGPWRKCWRARLAWCGAAICHAKFMRDRLSGSAVIAPVGRPAAGLYGRHGASAVRPARPVAMPWPAQRAFAPGAAVLPAPSARGVVH